MYSLIINYNYYPNKDKKAAAIIIIIALLIQQSAGDRSAVVYKSSVSISWSLKGKNRREWGGLTSHVVNLCTTDGRSLFTLTSKRQEGCDAAGNLTALEGTAALPWASTWWPTISIWRIGKFNILFKLASLQKLLITLVLTVICHRTVP